MQTDANSQTDAINRISTGGGITGSSNPMLHDNISRVIRWFKGRSTYIIRQQINPSFAWQPRFHDHIIRNEKSYNNIKKYIYENPQAWQTNKCPK